NGVQTIAPTSPLPAITAPVSIDGTTQSFPLVVLDGTHAGAASGLVLQASDCIVKGLVIDNFLQDGVSVQLLSDRNLIQGNLIGVDVTGSIAKSNENGVHLEGAANRIQGNVISGNRSNGVFAGQENVLVGNLIGTDAAGINSIGNGKAGVLITS